MNSCLSVVQKFNYLCAQLEEDAARVISGFPLTDGNQSFSWYKAGLNYIGDIKRNQ